MGFLDFLESLLAVDFVGKDLRYVLDANVRSLLVEAALNLHHAGGAADSDNFSAAVLDVIHFVFEDRHGNFRVLDTESAGHAAALVAVFHFYKFVVFSGVQKLALLFVDSQTTAHVARIVVSNFGSAGFLVEAALGGVKGSDELSEFLNLVGQFFRPSQPSRIVGENAEIGFMPGFGASGAAEDQDIGIHFFKGFNIALGNVFACVAVSHAEDRFAAAALVHGEDDFHIQILKYFDNGFASFGEDKVDVAACKEGYFLDRLVDFFGNFRYAVAEWRISDSRQAAILGHTRKEERQMTDDAAALERLLADGGHTQHRVEHLAVGKNVFKDDLGGKGEAVFFDRPRPQFVNQSRNVDFAGADFYAFATANAHFVNMLEVLHAMKESSQNGSNAAGVNVAEYVAAYDGVNRADIEARSATQTVEAFFEYRIFGGF